MNKESRGAAVTISVSREPEPEFAAKYRRANIGSHVLAELTVLEIYIQGIIRESMLPGECMTVHVGGDFEAVLTYQDQVGREDHPVILTAFPENNDPVYVSWKAALMGEQKAPLGPGRAMVLNPTLAKSWKITGRNW